MRIITLIFRVVRTFVSELSCCIFNMCCNTLKYARYLLTIMDFLNYSGRMDADLKALEEKLAHLISVCNDLRQENARLLVDLKAMQEDTALLKSRMAQASDRVEALMESLP